MLFTSDLVMFWRILDIFKKNFRDFSGKFRKLFLGSFGDYVAN